VGARAPWTICRETIAAGAVRRLSFPNAVALQVRGPIFVPGLLLRFVEDSIGDRGREWTVDAPGALVPWGGSDQAELVFPDPLPFAYPDGTTIEIAAYHTGAAPMLPAVASAAAAQRFEEVEVLAEGDDVSIAGSGSTVLFTSTDAARTVGVPELRRWSTVLGYFSTDSTGVAVPGEWFVILEVQVDGTWTEFALSRGSRGQQWVTSRMVLGHNLHLMVWPIPVGPWRVSIWNQDGGADEASYHIWRTTGLLNRSSF